MNDKLKKYLKIFVIIFIVSFFIGWLVILPLIKFKNNENKLKDAAVRYYEINFKRLPKNGKISTVTLKTLAKEAYIKEDFYVPLSNKVCDMDKGWVKVKKTDNGYKYYPYLECGFFKSKSDHNGPKIVLNGEKEIIINQGEKYVDPGVKKVVDDKDGKINIDKVYIDDSNVDTSTAGKYVVRFSVYDSFKNKSETIRNVNVVQKLDKTVLNNTFNKGIYKGNVKNNYITFGGVLYRILGIDKGNVKIIASRDIANVNHDSIDEWLKYYYEHIPDNSKKYLVKFKTCNAPLDLNTVENETSCAKYGKESYVGALSVSDLNNSLENGDSFLYTNNISWYSNPSSDSEAWAFRKFFIGTNKQYFSFPKDYNFGIRPVLCLKGDLLIKSGNGTMENPYNLGDLEPGVSDSLINTRYSGEYIKYSNELWRIVDTMSDGATKVISENTIKYNSVDLIKYEDSSNVKIYNPTKKGNVGYTINQKTSEVINPKYFVKHEFNVPIYKTVAKYKGEYKNKKYSAKFHAPDMYDLFSAPGDYNYNGYWLINSSSQEYMKYMVTALGTVDYVPTVNNKEQGVRVVGYFDKNCKIVMGDGTKSNPYEISI